VPPSPTGRKSRDDMRKYECICGHTTGKHSAACQHYNWGVIVSVKRSYNNNGTANWRFKHGKHGSSEYRAYHNARNRCNNPKMKNYFQYGGRGIKFLFASFEQFFAEIGECPTGMVLDRKDNNGHYEPGNVHWVTRPVSMRNRRKHLAIENFPDSALLDECRRRGLKEF
jgi:hypothetical protein